VAGGVPPDTEFETVRREIEFLLEQIDAGRVRACHDISEGGLAVAAAEMALAGRRGIRLEMGAAASGLRVDEALFTETGGFLVEVDEDDAEALLAAAAGHGVHAEAIGEVTRGRQLEVEHGGTTALSLDLEDLEPAWRGGIREALR
jgi:phosphoribosylformylglycinamidine synthase